MKSLRLICMTVLLLLVIVLLGFNGWFYKISHQDTNRLYQVEFSRLKQDIEQQGIENIDLSKYSYVKHISVLPFDLEDSLAQEQNRKFFEGDGKDSVVKYINGSYYRFDYEVSHNEVMKEVQFLSNAVLLLMAVMVIVIGFYLYIKLIRPFRKLRDIPYELSKGNLTVGLQENKNRFFGRFVWGLDLLREHLEARKKKELSMQKEKKTLILSISHDIKTPLSAIKLYSEALSRNLYESQEKRIQIANKIGEKADEIESFVSEIMKASSEDFLNLEVKREEFYLDALVKHIQDYYGEKLSLLSISFSIAAFENCLLCGELERGVEVLQNIIENAIKYGDGQYINIHVAREENYCLITVINSGCTLTQNEMSYIFNSFWRGSNVSDKSGSGLGLYICRQLMQKMDGDIYGDCEHGEMKITSVFRVS